MSNRTIEAILRISSQMGNMRALRTLQRELDGLDRRAKRFNAAQGVLARSTAGLWATTARVMAPAALAMGVQRSVTAFASVERRLNRIAINADAGKTAVKDMLATVHRAADDYAMAQDDIVTGLETLVAAGRDASDAMSFLPSVAATAQAAGANIEDIATTADAVSSSFGIAGDSMQRAFDILVTSGKQGKFELRDMASYLPSLAPAFAALGYEGEKGLGKLASMLQTIRMRTGSASEAATAAQNIIQKMESNETAKKFSQFGVDLRKEMAAARQEGRDLVDVFVELTEKATKGDLSKIPQLFTDAQFQVGMRALMSGRKDMEGFQAALANVDGATLKDLGQVLSDNQTKIDRMAASWTKFKTSLGEAAVNTGILDAIEAATNSIDYASAVNAGLEKTGKAKGFVARSLWGISNDQAAKDEMAWIGGYRTPEQARAIRQYDDYARSRMQADETTAPAAKDKHGLPVVGPIPEARGDPSAFERKMEMARLREQYSLYGYWPVPEAAAAPPPSSWRQFMFGDAASGTSVRDGMRMDVGYGALARKDTPSFRPEDFGMDQVGEDIAQGGERAGSSIEDAARAINEAGTSGGQSFGSEAGSTFKGMLDGMAAQFGASAAAAFRANVGTVTVRAEVSGAGRSPAGRDTGLTMPEAGQ